MCSEGVPKLCFPLEVQIGVGHHARGIEGEKKNGSGLRAEFDERNAVRVGGKSINKRSGFWRDKKSYSGVCFFVGSREENKKLLFGVQGMGQKKGLAGGIMGFLHDNNIYVMSFHMQNELVVLRGCAKSLNVPGNNFQTSVAGA